LEEVHRKTKIHMNVLKAIEEDTLVNFSPIYIKGFIKIYCNFLGVDPKDFIADYKETRPHPSMIAIEASQKPVLSKQPKAPKPVKPLNLPKIRFNNPRIISTIKTVILVVIVLLLTIAVLRFTKFVFTKFGEMFNKRKQAPISEIVTKQEKKAPLPKTQKAKVQEQAAPVKVKQPQAGVTEIRLSIRAKEDCWMQVKLDGKTVFQNILKKGRFESWKAKEKIELSLGNAGVAELEVNGKLISSLGRKGQSLKNILITKDGLSTSR